MHDSTWMAKVFSWKVWCMILFMYIMLTVCSFLSQIVLARIENKYKNTNFGEHLFYNFGMLCNQSMRMSNLNILLLCSRFSIIIHTFIILHAMKLNNNADITWCHMKIIYIIFTYICIFFFFMKKKRKKEKFIIF